MKKLLKTYFIFVLVIFTAGLYLHFNEDPNWAFVNEKGSWVLKKDSETFFIRGAVMHHKISRPELFEKIGGNAVRVQADLELISEAYDNGLYSFVNLPIMYQRDGMDWSCESQVEAQEKKIIEVVKKLKGHPGVMMWSLGNEHGIIPSNDYKYDSNTWKSLDRISRSVKSIDPSHPVGFCVGGSDSEKLSEIAEDCGNLDFIGINTYGGLKEALSEAKSVWKKPIVCTEWGIKGWWGQGWQAHWLVIEETTSFEKSKLIEERCRELEDGKDLCVGGFAFYWGDRAEQSTTWWGLLHDNLSTDSVGSLASVWNGVYADRSPIKLDRPVIKDLNGIALKEGELYATTWDVPEDFRARERPTLDLEEGRVYEASVFLDGVDHDTILNWEIREGTGVMVYSNSKDEIRLLEDLILTQEGSRITFKAPKDTGVYRLYVFAKKGEDHIAYANEVFTAGRLAHEDRERLSEPYETDPPVLLPCD